MIPQPVLQSIGFTEEGDGGRRKEARVWLEGRVKPRHHILSNASRLGDETSTCSTHQLHGKEEEETIWDIVRITSMYYTSSRVSTTHVYAI
jgi:hypothetical protein